MPATRVPSSGSRARDARPRRSRGRSARDPPPGGRSQRAPSSSPARGSCARDAPSLRRQGQPPSARTDRRRPTRPGRSTSDPQAEHTSGRSRSRAAIQPNSDSQWAWTRSGATSAETLASARLMRKLRSSGGPFAGSVYTLGACSAGGSPAHRAPRDAPRCRSRRRPRPIRSRAAS